MKTGHYLSISLLCAALAAPAQAAPPPRPALSSEALVYSHEEMFAFDTAQWLAGNAPHLLPQAETISHWAGYSTVSPRVLLALMDQQTGVVSRPGSDPEALDRPFGTLVEERGFSAQTREVALRLADAMYDLGAARAQGAASFSPGSPLQALAQLEAGERNGRADPHSDEDFQRAYARLFGTPRAVPPASPREGAAQAEATRPPVDLLEFPFPRGQRWHVGGAHGDSGFGRYPQPSIDMWYRGGWWSNQRNSWVTASAAGTYKRHSSCMAEVIHAGGFSTTYYHLDNLQPTNGSQLQANARIGNPANNRLQALCNGGSSTGPHQHWTLRYNGRPVHLHGVTVSGYRITALGNSYDTNCNRFHLTKDGQKYCSGFFSNPGPGPAD